MGCYRSFRLFCHAINDGSFSCDEYWEQKSKKNRKVGKVGKEDVYCEWVEFLNALFEISGVVVRFSAYEIKRKESYLQ